jgi:alpha-methylacyl-CoA racemase
VDLAMIDGVASLAAQYYPMSEADLWSDQRGTSYLDSGAPFYDVYACANDKFVAVAALQDRFYISFAAALGLDEQDLPARSDVATRPALGAMFGERLAARSRGERAEHFRGREACVSTVLTFAEAQRHPYAAARQAFVAVDGARQPAPAPGSPTRPARRPRRAAVTTATRRSSASRTGARQVPDRA